MHKFILWDIESGGKWSTDEKFIDFKSYANLHTILHGQIQKKIRRGIYYM